MPDFTVYAWIGWAIVTAALVPAWLLTGWLGWSVFDRLRRIYHLTVIAYWLDRLEKGGMRIFQRAEQEDTAKRAAAQAERESATHPTKDTP